ncbi:MAG TPA: cyclase family protein [Verrucomicrobiae bacterium]|jgi:kynurenine formamidase|nr:cyclase family protein [Verrucomicrobiae bacterium]
MRSIALAIITAAALALGGAPLRAQSWRMPPESERCPSKWGAGDQRGSGNLMKPETVLRAAKLIKSGEVFELGAVLSPDPKEAFINGNRVFNIYTKPALAVPNARQENEELVVTELGQIGTQFDAFAHQMWGDSFYNCFKLAEIGTRSGFKKLGVENVGGLMTRGVLIDVAALKGVDLLPNSYVITPGDLEQALAKASVKIERGDAVIIRTGWAKLMGKENQRYGSTPPGIGVAAAEWLAAREPMLIAADNCCVEARPSEPGTSLPVHAMMLIQHGIYLIENLELDALAAARAYEFAFIVQPLKLKGATGSAVAPIAVR